jgi:hypothetical protein
VQLVIEPPSLSALTELLKTSALATLVSWFYFLLRL